MELDKKDRQILMALQHDARQSLSALGKQIGLSQPAMSERVKKLEDAGVIAGYAARINLAAVGLGLQAVVRVRTTHEHIQRYVLLFQSLPEVLDVVRVTGEDCFVVRCAFGQPADLADLERVVDALAAFGSVSTSLVLSHPVNKAVPLG
ncbi:MAG: AsnC family transcriptional regulator [Acidovorax sp. SCN 65-108]|nr:MAG: AsnC family transcriptional regulator [Acidovorax sp. SCN 65-108]